jgi:uncharacterized protein DUF1572
MSDDLRKTLTLAFTEELDSALGRIAHCVGQLTDEQVWWRPRPDMNPIGNLILHLTGNVKQMIVSSLGGEPDDRDRPAEFAARDIVPKAELLRRLTDVVSRAKVVLGAAPAAELCRTRRVNTFELTGAGAIVRCVAHFRGHTQEIIHLTRTILADRYQYAGPR